MLYVLTDNGICSILYLCQNGIYPTKFGTKPESIKDDEPFLSEDDEIVLTEYQPNALTYRATASADRVAVFSEIYYPEGWHIYVDGKEIALGRVNYILRAAIIPSGEHTITMEFVPSILKWEWLCITLAILTILISAGCLGWKLWKSISNKELLS